MISARTSLNLELSTWPNRGIAFWEVIEGTISLLVTEPATVRYDLPTNLVTLLDLWYRQVDGYGPDQPSDRIMTPITRDQYAMMPNKLTPGIPTQYWFQMLETPRITIWQPPIDGQGSPNYELAWFGLQRIADASIGGQTYPDVPYRALEALCAMTAVRLFQKFGNQSNAGMWQAKLQALRSEAAQAWTDLQNRDQEPGSLVVQPNLSAYGQM